MHVLNKYYIIFFIIFHCKFIFGFGYYTPKRAYITHLDDWSQTTRLHSYYPRARLRIEATLHVLTADSINILTVDVDIFLTDVAEAVYCYTYTSSYGSYTTYYCYNYLYL